MCDVIEERATAAAEPFGAKVYLSFHQMVVQEKLDALYVCLPPGAHVDQELMAIGRGIHLFVEKPLPLDLAKATFIARRAREANVVTAVGFHWRYWQSFDLLDPASSLRRRTGRSVQEASLPNPRGGD